MPTMATRPPAPSSDAPVRPLTGGKVLAMLLCFFAVMFAVNGFMAYAAITTFRGADTESVYAASKAFPLEIAAAKRQSELGWSVDLHTARVADGDAAIAVTPFDAKGVPVRGLTVTARFEHPSDRYKDQVVALEESKPGVYEAQTGAIGAGAWDITVEAVRDGERVYRTRNRALLP